MTQYIRVVREAGGLGDLVRVLAVCQGVRKKYPQARLHLYGAKYLQDLLAPRSSAFDLYIGCDYGLRSREQSLDEARLPHLNRGITYQKSFCCWCWAYLHEQNTEGVCAQDRIELWCEHSGVEPSRPRLKLLDIDLDWRDHYREKYKDYMLVGVQPGATCRSREWPYDYWDKLNRLFWGLDVRVILFDVCYRWQKEVDTNYCEVSIEKPWPETLGKLAACNLIITPDSGFYHLAGALKLKTLGLFGTTSGKIISRPWNWEERTHHYLQLAHNEIDYSKLPGENGCGRKCTPSCYQRWERGWDADRYRKQGEYCELMTQLTPDLVLEKAMELLGKDRNGTQS